jgi:hypothetical protein
MLDSAKMTLVKWDGPVYEKDDLKDISLKRKSMSEKTQPITTKTTTTAATSITTSTTTTDIVAVPFELKPGSPPVPELLLESCGVFCFASSSFAVICDVPSCKSVVRVAVIHRSHCAKAASFDRFGSIWI